MTNTEAAALKKYDLVRTSKNRVYAVKKPVDGGKYVMAVEILPRTSDHYEMDGQLIPRVTDGHNLHYGCFYQTRRLATAGLTKV